eukprot:TRINITY_DN28608_c0_g2_i1.p1 TRINITY_DN28608_c0_g2~~TRINITY_DN28608_c0_g2_i1.p1  ORF type:complete len:4151 (-),score=822.11 TRINITY_DN28608_c0_g2_i1:49-11319(-)
MAEGTMFTLAGQFYAGRKGDFGQAQKAELYEPMGLALDKDNEYLYIADAGSDRVRRIDLTKTPINSGIITTVAGNGFPGFSGDGGPAIEAQLNRPTGVAVDLNSMLWICDYGNDVIRVVSMEIPIRIPGTNEFQANIILAAAGSGQGESGSGKGDGGVAWMAKVQAPLGIAVSSTYISPEEGTLPVSVYLSEEIGNQVRSLSLDYRSYLGVMNTLVGSGEKGSELKEAPLETKNAQLTRPSGIAVDGGGTVYVSDTGNNRLLMLPALEFVSMGCWRENIDSPWIPSIEGKPRPWGSNYLTGVPENRLDAITMCALAALQRGYEVFAVRQMGVCATSRDAHLYFRYEGSSTSCADGKGGARDNSVYRFAREGMMTQMQGLAYILAGREGLPSFSGDLGSAWVSDLNGPTGLGVNPETKDLWIADTGNNRLRLIFNGVGPKLNHRLTCTNGYNCKVELQGNGLQPGNQLAMVEMFEQCGEETVTFIPSVVINPATDIPSPSFTKKTYEFGTATAQRAGEFRLCYCIKDSVVKGQAQTCDDPSYFIRDAGIVTITGADARLDDDFEAMPGRQFSLVIHGLKLSVFDRIRIVNEDQRCGRPGSEVLSPEVISKSILLGQRHLGNETFALWQNVSLRSSGTFRVCWCQGATTDGTKMACDKGQDFRVEAKKVIIRGPVKSTTTTIDLGGAEDLTLEGNSNAGFDAGDRIRIVDAATVKCGTPEAKDFSSSIDWTRGAIVPAGYPTRLSQDTITWTNIQVRSSKLLRVCWCGSGNACEKGEDFITEAALVQPTGPRTHPPHVIEVATNGTRFAIELFGSGFTGRERITLVDDYTPCGSRFSAFNSAEMTSQKLTDRKGPQLVNSKFIRWFPVEVAREAIYRICYCLCKAGRFSTDCCQNGEDFYTDLGAVYVGSSGENFTATELDTPKFTFEKVPPRFPPSMWETVPQDELRDITVRAKTMDSPYWAGSVGPIEVSIFQDEEMLELIETFTLTQMGAKQTKTWKKTIILNKPMKPHGILINAKTPDAWLGEWIEVEIEGMGMHRFVLSGWTVFPADRQARRVTEQIAIPPAPTTVLPFPSAELWESRYLIVDACGGCPHGYECVEAKASTIERLQREVEVGLVYTERGVSNEELADLTVFRAQCKPICGDGFAQRGEQCDDGNLRSLDGCNAMCQVEHGFECANFPDAVSSCMSRLCDHTPLYGKNDMVSGRFPEYGEDQFNMQDSLGSTCAVNVSLDYKAPPKQRMVCYEWPEQNPWPPEMCPEDKSDETLKSWVFAPAGDAVVDCRSYKMVFEGKSLQCNFTKAWEPSELHVRSYDDCAQECLLDHECRAMRFYIKAKPSKNGTFGGESGDACDHHDVHCKPVCHLLDSCDHWPMDWGEVPDQYYVGKKVAKTDGELPINRICSKVESPRPVYAYEDGGVVVISFDSAVDPPGANVGEAFLCSELLTSFSQDAVGGAAASCTFVAGNVLHISLGPTATLARPVMYDAQGWLRGDPRELFFIQSKLVPRGLPEDMREDKFEFEDAALLYGVQVRKTHSLLKKEVDKPELPKVIIRGPSDLGGCGDLELMADVSENSRGRRWKKVEWTCMETRPDGSLDDNTKDRLYNACGKIVNPILKRKSWCRDSSEQAVAQPCELRAVIPASEWCGLAMVKLKVTLTNAEGFVASSEWTTNILPMSRIPTTGAVGPSTFLLSPQRKYRAPIEKLKLEVSTESDAKMVGRCTCNLTRAPNPDGSESRVVVDWYYGEVVNGLVPRFFEMTKVTNDENPSANAMVVPLKGEIMKPKSHWLYIARVAYAVHSDQEAAIVPFNVSVGPLEPPEAYAVGPARVNNDQCQFVIDARLSKIKEILYFQEQPGGRRLDALASTRGLQAEGDAEAPTEPPENSSEAEPSVSTGVTQELEYKWTVKQLRATRDDYFRLQVPEALMMILQLEKQTDPQFIVQQGMLPTGMYIFTVEVSDKAIPGLSSTAQVTVEIHQEVDVPVMTAEGPVGKLGPEDSVEVVFKQVGFGDCLVPTAALEAGLPRTSLVLMKGVVGQPRRYMRAVAEVEYKNRVKDMAGGIANSLWITASAPRELFQPGFIYFYRLIQAGRKRAPKMKIFKEAMLAAGQDSTYEAGRDLSADPTEAPKGVVLVDSEPFGMHVGPVSGSLEVAEPRGRIGIAMSDLFRVQQVWATDNPPLEYAFYYGQVPADKQQQFKEELMNFDTDIFTDQRLASLLEGQPMVPLSDWSQVPNIAAPLSEGTYVFEGRVRDATGIEAKKYAVAEAVPAYKEQIVTSADRVEALEAYMRSSRKAILQVRAYNRGAVSVVPVTAAVFALPNLYDYDFRSMMEWNPAQGRPMPNLSQPIYGSPIVSRETRAEVVGYLTDLLSVLSDIVEALDAEALGADVSEEEGRRMQGLTFTPITNASTPSHVEAVSQAFAHLAKNIPPVNEPELGVYLGRNTAGLLEKIREARGDIRKSGNAPMDLVKTMAYLLAAAKPIEKPRDGILELNVTQQVQTQLSKEIIRSAVVMGDVMAAIADIDGEPMSIKVEMPKGKFLGNADGDFIVTIIKKSLTEIIMNGVATQPDFQSMQRWIYPKMDIAGLGAPGFMGASWAGEEGIQADPNKIQCQEKMEGFLQTITVTSIAWPINPFTYATGSLVGMDANVSMPYTVQMRSCGNPVVVQGMSGKIQMTFRLSASVVRDRRWGYGELSPYRVAWWEDIPGVSEQADRIRRWTTHGCKTEWDRNQEDMVTARCDRLPSSDGGVFVVELVPRPIFEMEGQPGRSRNIHNVMSYTALGFLIRWIVLLFMAYRQDTVFWPSEKQLMKLLYLPHERKWRERLRRGRLPPPEPITWNPFSGNFWYQTKMLWIDRIIWAFCAFKAFKGSELFMTVEVRELIKMRSGERDLTYERFVESMNEKDNMEKIEFVKEQRSIAAAQSRAALPPPSHGITRHAAVRDAAAVEALQDEEVSYRNQAHDMPLPSGSYREPSEPPEEPMSISQLRAAVDTEDQREIEEVGMRTGDATGKGPVVQNTIVQAHDDDRKAEAALNAALFAGKVGGLPPGWEEYVSEEHGGRVYYVFSQTGDTTWERPTLMPDGSVQFLTMQDPTSPTASSRGAMSSGKLQLPELRGKGKKLGSLKRQSDAIKGVDGEKAATGSSAGATLRNEAKHRSAPPLPPGDTEEDERTPVEREREVPPFRRLPLLREEAVHGAPVPALTLAPDEGRYDSNEPDSVREALGRSLAAAQNSQEVVLPTGWELQSTVDGREFYVNLRAGITQWNAPQLPPHWEERFSRDGKVYYLSLFDGRTQWEWPQENALAFQQRLEELPANRLALALPGQTQELETQSVQRPDSDSESSDGVAMDQVDAMELLENPPGGEGSILTPREEDEKKKQLKWGQDKRDVEWLALKKEMGSQKQAHDERWMTARQFPGVREFVRRYELANQTNNWDRAVDGVTLKIDNIDRSRGELGDRAELRKEELRQIFPIIQRLQWTKWSSLEIWLHCIIREMPVQAAFFSHPRPSKTHRTILHIFSVIVTLLGSAICVAFEAPVDENVEATSRATWDLLAEALTMPVTGNTLLCSAIGLLSGFLVKKLILRIFYGYRIPYNLRPTTSPEARKYQLRYWHELAEMGKWTCLIGSFMAYFGALSMCMLTPQPRSGCVFQAFWIALLIGHYGWPILKGTACTIILTTARTSGSFDGWLTVWPNLMDFGRVGVKTTEFMVWRAQRMIAEEELLLQVYPDLPMIGRKVRDPSMEEEMTAPPDPNVINQNAIMDHSAMHR